MRIIDADYVIEKLNEINGTAELDKAFEVVENAPTVDVLDKIRAEIDGIEITGQIDEHTSFIRTGDSVKKIVLEILDKYR